MKKYLIITASAALFVAWAGLCSAQSDAPYTEGSVWQITMVKTKYGMSDDYLKGLAKTFKGTLDEAKKQNLIMMMCKCLEMALWNMRHKKEGISR